jgi:(2Fe-2S) ferredoxin
MSKCTMYVKKYEFVSLSQLADCTRLRGASCAWAAGIVIIFLVDMAWHSIARSCGSTRTRMEGTGPERQTNGMAHWYGAVQFREAQSARASLLYAGRGVEDGVSGGSRRVC